MARNTLGMLLAGLGGGLTGYGQEQERKAKRDEEARQREFTEGLMLSDRRFEPEDLAKTRSERVGSALQQAGQVAGTLSVPGMSGRALESALMQAAQVAPQAEMQGGNLFEAGGRRYIQRASQTPEAIATRERDIRTAEAIASAERQAALQAERDRMLGAQRMAEIAAQTASAERIAGLRTSPRSEPISPVMSLPSVERRNVIGNLQKVSVIDSALEELAKRPESVGMSRGLTPGFLRDRNVPFVGDPEGVAARALLANLASLEIRDRSGAAVTAVEFPRLRPFIPDVQDDYKTVVYKLEQMKRVINDENLIIGETFGVDLSGVTSALMRPTSGMAGNQPNQSNMSAAERLRSGRY